MKKRKKQFPDKLYIGLITGIAVPVIAFYTYYRLKFAGIGFFDFVWSVHQYQLLFKIMSLCVLSNLPVFYLFMYFKKMLNARGVVMACVIFALLVLVYRIVN